MTGTLLAWVGVLGLVAVALAGVSLALHWRAGTATALVPRVHALESDLNDLYDRVEHWQRRDRVRRLREGPGPEQLQQAAPAPGTAEYKQAYKEALRMRAMRTPS